MGRGEGRRKKKQRRKQCGGKTVAAVNDGNDGDEMNVRSNTETNYSSKTPR